MFSSFLFYGIFLKNRCSSCSILVDIAIFISSSLLLYQLLSNQESRNHSVDTSSRKGFKCKRFVTEVFVGRAGSARGGKEGVCGGARRRKEFVAQRSGSCLWAGAQESALTGICGLWLLLLEPYCRNPEASTPLVLLEPVVCAVACSPSRLLTAAAADRPEAGKKCVSLPVTSLQPWTEPNGSPAGKGVWEIYTVVCRPSVLVIQRGV